MKFIGSPYAYIAEKGMRTCLMGRCASFCPGKPDEDTGYLCRECREAKLSGFSGMAALYVEICA